MWNRQQFLLLSGAGALSVLRGPLRAVAANGLAPPRGRVVLTVSGAIGITNAPGRADFDLDTLERLGLRRLTTWTPWTEGEVEFEGVWARRLMDAVHAKGTEVDAVASMTTSIPSHLKILTHMTYCLRRVRTGS